MSEEQLLRLARTGRLLPDDEVFEEGSTKTHLAKNIKGFKCVPVQEAKERKCREPVAQVPTARRSRYRAKEKQQTDRGRIVVVILITAVVIAAIVSLGVLLVTADGKLLTENSVWDWLTTYGKDELYWFPFLAVVLYYTLKTIWILACDLHKNL